MLSGGACCINVIALLPFALWLYWLFIPAPLVIEAQEAGGTIYFSANRGVVFAPNDCVTLRWSVEDIQAVYLNEQAQTGSGEEQFCLAQEQPALRVIFQDDSEQTYRLNVTPLLTHPITGIVIAAVGFMAAPYLSMLLLFPLRTAMRLAVWITLGALFLTQLLPLTEIVATANWRDAAAAFASLLTAWTLIVFLLLAVYAQTSQPARLLTFWFFGVGVLLVSVAFVIVYVNPRGMYFSDAYRPHQLLLRERKTADFRNLPATPDLVILGSSRAFTLSPSTIEQRTGLTAYNMAIEGGRIEDVVIQVRQMRELPEILLIEVQEGLPREPNDIAARAPFNWLPYMSRETSLLTLQRRLTGLVDLSHFSEALYILRYNALYERQPQEWPFFAADGMAVRPTVSAAQLEQAILLDIGNIPPAQCVGVDAQSQTDMQTLIATAKNRRLVFYLSPWHPRYREAVLDENLAYQACYAAFTAYMSDLTEQNPNVDFVDASQLDTLDLSEAGFYDSQHLTEANSSRLIDVLAETLQAS